MQNTIAPYLANISAAKDAQALQAVLQYVARQVNTVAVATAGLVIKGATLTLAKTGSTAFQATVGGRIVTIAASTDMPALTGLTITANSFNVACFFIDASGTVSVRFGVEGTTAAKVKFPDFPIDKALVGYLLITHSSTFTGGTTALDTATTVYVSPVGAFDPTFIYS
jgi:DNA-binding phage protein